MELAIFKLSYVFITFPFTFPIGISSPTMLFVIFILSYIFTTIRPGISSLTMSQVIFPLSYVAAK